MMRNCDLADARTDRAVTAQIQRNQRAVRFADVVRDGHSIAATARLLGVYYNAVYRTLKNACPPFLAPAAPPPSPEPTKRPDWSCPDERLLRLAREARAEIEASGWFGRRNAS